MHPQHVAAATACAVFALFAPAGCSDSDSDWGEELVGIYAVESLTENSQSCDTEGASILTDDRDHMLVFSGSDRGGRWLRADGCADVAACRQRVRDIQENRGILVTFSFIFSADKGDHFEGDWVTTGYSGGPVCTDGEVTRFSLATPAENTVRIEARSVVVDHPPDADGICWTYDTQAAAAGQPCNLFRTVGASRLEAL